jgi:hypothetical protein
MMATPGAIEGIRMPIQAGDMEIEGVVGIGVANGMAGIALMTCAAPATASVPELLERNEH